jgi:alpha-mannosidase
MKRIFIIAAIIAAAVGVWYFFIKKKDDTKPEGSQAPRGYDGSGINPEASAGIIAPKSLTQIAQDKAEEKAKNLEELTALQSAIKPNEAVKLDSEAVSTQIEKLSKLYVNSRNPDYIAALETAGIGKDLVPTDAGWYVDNFLNKKYGSTNFANICVKPLDYFPTDLRSLKNDIATLKSIKARVKMVGNKDEAKQFQNVVKGSVQDVTGIDLFFSKNADDRTMAKLKDRIDFTVKWIETYIRYGSAASEISRSLAINSMKAAGWQIKGINA